jgi:hypothetical protein
VPRIFLDEFAARELQGFMPMHAVINKAHALERCQFGKSCGSQLLAFSSQGAASKRMKEMT